MTEVETILLERAGGVAVITLNRPEARNALDAQVLADLTAALDELEADRGIGAVVLTGSDTVFSIGVDPSEVLGESYMDMFFADPFAGWGRLGSFRKPVVAAVAGDALRGGCELAMMCDMVIAADTAKFGQPEIKFGYVPSMGGTQRLIRAIGKAKAMEMILTGREMDAEDAERAGLVTRVVPAAELRSSALALADTIATMSLPALMIAKEAVNQAYETVLSDGLRFERRVFYSLFAVESRNEDRSGR